MHLISSAKLEKTTGVDSSDKIYTAKLSQTDDGNYIVEISWGRRGGASQSNVKYAGAQKSAAWAAYNKVVAEKVDQGYFLVDGS